MRNRRALHQGIAAPGTHLCVLDAGSCLCPITAHNWTTEPAGTLPAYPPGCLHRQSCVGPCPGCAALASISNDLAPSSRSRSTSPSGRRIEKPNTLRSPQPSCVGFSPFRVNSHAASSPRRRHFARLIAPSGRPRSTERRPPHRWRRTSLTSLAEDRRVTSGSTPGNAVPSDPLASSGELLALMALLACGAGTSARRARSAYLPIGKHSWIDDEVMGLKIGRRPEAMLLGR